MHIDQFTAFYPSRPFWAGSKVDFSVTKKDGWFYEQMIEEVFSEEAQTYKVKVCRDGRIMLRVEALELPSTGEPLAPIEQTVKRWGEYLDYLNAFYLLLDSATIEKTNLSYFNLSEITNRDAFRVRYENGQSVGENIATESVASIFQMGRYSSSYHPSTPIEYDPRILMRQVIPMEVIQHAASGFARVVTTPGLEKALSSFAKSLSEYKFGNYETSIVLAWFITEAALNKLWATHIDQLNKALPDGRKRINRQRRDFLIGRDFTISVVSNMLELWGVLPHADFQDIDSVRGFRNKIVHSLNFTPGAIEAELAMKTARSMIERIWNLQFIPNMGYSVVGL